MSTTFAVASMIPAVKARVIALLTDETAFAGLQLSYSQPATRLERSSFWLGETTGRHDISAIRAGRKPRTETFEIDGYIYVWKPSGRPEEAEAEAFTLLAAIEDVLADAPQLDLGPSLQWAKVGAIKGTDCGPRETGADAVIHFAIECQARLD